MSSETKIQEQKLLENPGALCGIVRRIVIEAGEITEKYLDTLDDMQVDTKHDNSPVTLADREAEAFIQMSLERLLPNVPIVGEEAVALGKQNADLRKTEYFWLVDPLDGTKEYIAGGGDYTVNVALIKNNEPILGIVYAPSLGHLYTGHGANTAMKWNIDTGKDKPISVRSVPKEGMTVVASKSHGDTNKLDTFLEKFKVNKLVKRGSSLKICTIAEGKADMYPRFGPTCEWDTAAGDAVLRAAGGIMTDTNGTPMRYGGFNAKYLNPEFIASSFEWFETAEKSSD